MLFTSIVSLLSVASSCVVLASNANGSIKSSPVDNPPLFSLEDAGQNWARNCTSITNADVEKDPRFNKWAVPEIKCWSPSHRWNIMKRTWFIKLPMDDIWDEKSLTLDKPQCGRSVITRLIDQGHWYKLPPDFDGWFGNAEFSCELGRHNTARITVQTCRTCKIAGVNTTREVEKAIEDASCGYFKPSCEKE